jgi:hypothetical protein
MCGEAAIVLPRLAPATSNCVWIDEPGREIAGFGASYGVKAGSLVGEGDGFELAVTAGFAVGAAVVVGAAVTAGAVGARSEVTAAVAGALE